MNFAQKQFRSNVCILAMGSILGLICTYVFELANGRQNLNKLLLFWSVSSFLFIFIVWKYVYEYQTEEELAYALHQKKIKREIEKSTTDIETEIAQGKLQKTFNDEMRKALAAGDLEKAEKLKEIFKEANKDD